MQMQVHLRICIQIDIDAGVNLNGDIGACVFPVVVRRYTGAYRYHRYTDMSASGLLSKLEAWDKAQLGSTKSPKPRDLDRECGQESKLEGSARTKLNNRQSLDRRSGT